LSIYDNYKKTINDVNICTWINLKKSNKIYHVYSLVETNDLIALGRGERHLSKDDFFEQDADDLRIFR